MCLFNDQTKKISTLMLYFLVLGSIVYSWWETSSMRKTLGYRMFSLKQLIKNCPMDQSRSFPTLNVRLLNALDVLVEVAPSIRELLHYTRLFKWTGITHVCLARQSRREYVNYIF